LAPLLAARLRGPFAPRRSRLFATRGGPSEGLTLQNAAEERHAHDLQIESDRPVLDVIEVELDAFFERGVAAPAVHLRPAGDAGLHFVPEHVLREAMLELVDKERPLGPRPDNGHIALEDVPNLWELIQV